MSDVNNILEDIETFKEHCEDINTFMDHLYCRFTEPGAFELDSEYLGPLLTIPEKQLYGLLGIPYEYIKRCNANLIQCNTNYWIQELKSKQILIRKYNNIVRGILSDRYNTIFDDHVTIPIVIKSINEINEGVNKLFPVDFSKDSQFMMLYFTGLLDQVEYENYKFTPRIEISNSEIGLFSFRIKPCVSIYNPNTNVTSQLTSLSHNGLTKISHLKQLNSEEELKFIVHQGIINAYEAAFLGIKEAIQLLKEPVSDPKEELSKIGKECNLLSKRIQKVILERYENSEVTKLQLIEDILETMKGAPLFKYIILQEKLCSHFHLFNEIKETKSQIINVSKKEEVDFRFNLDL